MSMGFEVIHLYVIHRDIFNLLVIIIIIQVFICKQQIIKIYSPIELSAQITNNNKIE